MIVVASNYYQTTQNYAVLCNFCFAEWIHERGLQTVCNLSMEVNWKQVEIIVLHCALLAEWQWHMKLQQLPCFLSFYAIPVCFWIDLCFAGHLRTRKNFRFRKSGSLEC